MKRILVFKEESYEIAGAMYEVYNSLGYGHKESVYQKAITKELDARGINYKEQLRANLKYKDKNVGCYILDFLVEDKIAIELKQKSFISKKDIDQLYRYLRAMKLKLGLLVSMTRDCARIKRVVNLY